MNRCFIQQSLVLLFVCLLFSCSSTNNKPLLIDFSTDSSAIVFSHIDRAGLTQLKNTNVGDSILKNLVSVLEMPTELDTTFQEHDLKGRVLLTDSTLVFIPETPFVKGRNYLVITHLNSRFGDMKAMMKAELKTNVQPLQKVLIR